MSKPLFKPMHFFILMSTPAYIPEVAANIANAKTKELTSLFSVQLDMHDKIVLLEKKLAKAVEALREYCDDAIYNRDENGDSQIEAMDYGKVARQVLKECGE